MVDRYEWLYSISTSKTFQSAVAPSRSSPIEDPVVIDKIVTHLDKKAMLNDPVVLPQPRSLPPGIAASELV